VTIPNRLFLIQSSIIGHLSYIHNLDPVNSVTINIGVQVSALCPRLCSLDIYLGTLSLDHMIVLCLVFFEESPYCFP
jgi:hypothetical protein